MTRILISGAGIGGLALAHALRRGGLDVAVYEREPSPQSRNQGYRLHLDPDGNAALRACLPPAVLDRVRDTSGVNGDLVASFTQDLRRVHAQEFPGIPDSELTTIDRDRFRRGLLSGLAEVVTFGRPVTGYEITRSGRVSIGFDEGDLLVGADGVGSAVRRQLLPHATLRDLGLRCVYGRLPLPAASPTPPPAAHPTPAPGLASMPPSDSSRAPWIPADFQRGFCWVAGDNGFGAGFAPVHYRDGQPGYLMIALVGAADRFDPAQRDPADLWQTVTEATADWHPEIQKILAYADSASFFPITIRASDRVDAWPTGPVTLLGDAVHTMPPAGGVGANTALQDAATLAGELLSGAPLLDAVASYERQMLPRGFDTVERSVRMIEQMTSR
ncbi:2-polyprenyl-6-methoxyphenol hydroxylase-like FAD-dependent oxidoreductase [Actinoplanes octamycinicus]|uniref:2-polyprenyl-6-methoxyphenol hydroxylase-like FAD-dependent oxidoreductase n=1 Tax=Actinoplanes octamycinicus TaxID=135948 RepID=A0A7W7H3Z8_9ACTN|nr:NAD(P)/FAD-dependent oxidoreductase [Actinoplanes octamycinicus]MBB4743571.1 2-polyprenyl-6-methoxyphenol hydroxylase-like FAD-dependent oxidoreductase [Actinoplanes octamycinicus]GIE62439.1 monooxygenase [Actinoplanes octamycinicus]